MSRITTSYYHGMKPGEIIRMGPVLRRVTSVVGSTFDVRPLRWYERVWWEITRRLPR